MGAPPAVPPILILRFPRAAPHPWGATPPARPFVGAGLGPAPTKGLESAGQIQAPLKRGLSPPKAVTGGFSSPAGATEKGRRRETLRHGFAVPPPFSREVLRTGGPLRIPAPALGGVLRGARRGRRALHAQVWTPGGWGERPCIEAQRPAPCGSGALRSLFGFGAQPSLKARMARASSARRSSMDS